MSNQLARDTQGSAEQLYSSSAVGTNNHNGEKDATSYRKLVVSCQFSPPVEPNRASSALRSAKAIEKEQPARRENNMGNRTMCWKCVERGTHVRKTKTFRILIGRHLVDAHIPTTHCKVPDLPVHFERAVCGIYLKSLLVVCLPLHCCVDLSPEGIDVVLL